MAFDVPVTAQQTVRKVVEQQLDISTVRVSGVHFDFDDKIAQALVSYGDVVDGNFVPAHQEAWVLTGDYYLAAFTKVTTVDEMIADALLRMVAETVTEILQDQTLRNSLLENGQMAILSPGHMQHFSDFNKRIIRARDEGTRQQVR